MSSNYSGVRTLNSVSFPCRVRTPQHTRGPARASHAVLGLGLHDPAGAPSQTPTTAHMPCSGRYDDGAELVGPGQLSSTDHFAAVSKLGVQRLGCATGSKLLKL